MEKPLPCPFCGKLPNVHPKRPDVQGNAWGMVQCENSRCATYDPITACGVSVQDGATISDERGSAAYKQAAIQRWNRRAEKKD